MFADDIALYCPISAAADYIMLQSDISAIDHWVQDNFLSFNPGKCCTMFISHKSLHSNPPSTLFLGSSALTRVNLLFLLTFPGLFMFEISMLKLESL